MSSQITKSVILTNNPHHNLNEKAQKDLIRTYVQTNMLIGCYMKELDALSKGYQTRSYSNEQRDIIKEIANDIFSQEDNDEEDLEDPKVRQKAGSWFDILTNQFSKSKGIQSKTISQNKQSIYMKDPVLFAKDFKRKGRPSKWFVKYDTGYFWYNPKLTKEGIAIQKDIDECKDTKYKKDLIDLQKEYCKCLLSLAENVVKLPRYIANIDDWPNDFKNAYIESVKKEFPTDINDSLPRKLVRAGLAGPNNSPLIQDSRDLLGFKHSEYARGIFSKAAYKLSSTKSNQLNRIKENEERLVKAQKFLAGIPHEVQMALVDLETEYLHDVSVSIKEGSFHITGKQLKGFSKIRTKWLESKDDPIKIATEFCITNQEGDINLFTLLYKRPCIWQDNEDFVFHWSRYWALIVPYKNHKMTPAHPVLAPEGIEYGSGTNQLKGVGITKNDRQLNNINGSPSFWLTGSVPDGLEDRLLKGSPNNIGLEVFDDLCKTYLLNVPFSWSKRLYYSNSQLFLRRGSKKNSRKPLRGDKVTLGGSKLIFNRKDLETPIDNIAFEKALCLIRKTILSDINITIINKIVNYLYLAWGKKLPNFELHLSLKIEKKDISFSKKWIPGTKIVGYDQGVRNDGGVCLIEVVADQANFRIDSKLWGRILDECVMQPKGFLEENPKADRIWKLLNLAKKVLKIQSNLVKSNDQQGIAFKGFSELRKSLEYPNINDLPSKNLLFDAVHSFKNSSDNALIVTENLSRALLRCIRQARLIDPVDMGGLSDKRISLLENLLDYEKSYVTRTFIGLKGKLVLPQKFGINNLKHIKNLRKQITALVTERYRNTLSKLIDYAIKHNSSTIIIENLSFSRSWNKNRRQNRMLSRWLQAKFLDELRSKASLHGIKVIIVNPYLTSRFDIYNRPGIRASVLKQRLIESDRWSKALKENHNLSEARIGDLIPDWYGEYFICLDQDGKLIISKSDSTAALTIAGRGTISNRPDISISTIPFRESINVITEPKTKEGWVFSDDPSSAKLSNEALYFVRSFANKDMPKKTKWLFDINTHTWNEQSTFWPSLEAKIIDELQKNYWNS